LALETETSTQSTFKIFGQRTKAIKLLGESDINNEEFQIYTEPNHFSREMVQYIITPWRNKDELLQVRHRLYRSSQGKPPSISSRRHAVAQVSVWVQRGNCPHLVESTAILTSAILNDVPGNSTYCVRAAYSAAFCR
jgi:hypothetical protein